jgi:hypothetical protein
MDPSSLLFARLLKKPGHVVVNYPCELCFQAAFFLESVFPAAALVVLVLLRWALQPLHAQLLFPPQAMLYRYALALYDTLASSPKGVSPGQPAGAVQW